MENLIVTNVENISIHSQDNPNIKVLNVNKENKGIPKYVKRKKKEFSKEKEFER